MQHYANLFDQQINLTLLIADHLFVCGVRNLNSTFMLANTLAVLHHPDVYVWYNPAL